MTRKAGVKMKRRGEEAMTELILKKGYVRVVDGCAEIEEYIERGRGGGGGNVRRLSA